MSETVNDEFGVRKIYSTNMHPNRAKPWLLGKDDWLRRRYNGVGDWNDCPTSTDNNGAVIINFNASDGKGRLPVLALRGDQYPSLPPDDLPIIVSATTQSSLIRRGFMGAKNDWKNVEVTLYWKLLDTVDEQHTRRMQFGVRSGPVHSDTFIVGLPCEGTSLYVGLGPDGLAKVEKELGHPDYSVEIFADENFGNSKNKWIGMKGIFYTKASGNPFIELWLDKNADNNWEFVHSKEDDGSWFLKEGTDNRCGGGRNEKVTWGGPGVIFKLDGLKRVDMKWGSIREIMPPEGWPLRYLLNARGVSAPFSIRDLAQEYGLSAPISLRELTELEAERFPFP